MEAWLEERRRTASGGAPPPEMRRRTVSGSSTSSMATQPKRSHSSHSSNHSSRGRVVGEGEVEDWPPLPAIITERKEEGEEDEDDPPPPLQPQQHPMQPLQPQEQDPSTVGGRSGESSSSRLGGDHACWIHCILCGFVGATMAWYCWGLTFFAPLGPSNNVIEPEVARQSHRLAPSAFYALQAGRLVGAPLFGHLGDRKGRRVAFALSLAVLGLATVAMGCFYPLHRNGQDHGPGVRAAWAGLRFFVGMGVAGQCAGNMLLGMEACRTEKGGAVAAAIGHVGLPVGLALAAAVAYACLLEESASVRFPEGLRLAQWAGVLLLPMALWAYTGEDESPPFKEVEEAGETERWPLLAMVRSRGWGLLGAAVAIVLDCFTKATVVYYWPLILPHALNHGGLNVYACLAIALLAMATCTLLVALLRERLVKRCMIFRAGAAITTAGMLAWFRLVWPHNPPLLLAGDLLVLGLGLGTMHGAMDALLVEPFPTAMAYSGSGVLYQATNALVHIVYPSLAYWLLGLSEASHVKALEVAPGVNGIGHVVTTFVLGAMAMLTTTYLKAYHAPYVAFASVVHVSVSVPLCRRPALHSYLHTL